MNHDDLAHRLEKLKQSKTLFNLYCSQYDTSVDMLELWYDTFTYMFALLVILGNITSERIQYGNSAPLGAFVECDEEFAEDGGRNRE